MSEEDPKIIIDDDWKSQVEKEKEQLQEEIEKQASEGEASQLPEASFSMLVTTLAMQAGASLGQFPDPTTGKPKIEKPIAKHYIDTLAVLEDKTKGNLDKEESDLINSTIHQLRMAFVTMPNSLPEEAPAEEKKSSIELP